MSDQNKLNAEHLQTMQEHVLFSKLPEQVLQHLHANAHTESFAEGDTLINQGEFNYFLFLIVSGAVSVVTDGEKVASLQQGDVVGEISTSGLSSPVADVFAEEGVQVLAFPIGEISEIAFEHEAFADVLRHIGMHRIEPENY
ncbi:MAG: cyclic nucleotide-binding domain-containing protein [Mariprofundaceae bacterium]|nr:cyclic nucleotide-binding domain-containing protein [Mariprofundaceae bacterium]